MSTIRVIIILGGLKGTLLQTTQPGIEVPEVHGGIIGHVHPFKDLSR